jgi:hypothetical protein
MMKNPEAFARWEREWIANEPADLMTNLRLVDAMAAEAVTLGVWPAPFTPEDLAFKVRFARDINVRRPA